MTSAHSDLLPEPAAASGAHSGPAHAGWKTYVLVGVILTAITMIEVAVFYVPALHAVMVPILLALSTTKFLIVVLWFMHLRYDSRVFGRVFFTPLSLAVLVVIGMVLLFKVVPHFR